MGETPIGLKIITLLAAKPQSIIVLKIIYEPIRWREGVDLTDKAEEVRGEIAALEKRNAELEDAGSDAVAEAQRSFLDEMRHVVRTIDAHVQRVKPLPFGEVCRLLDFTVDAEQALDRAAVAALKSVTDRAWPSTDIKTLSDIGGVARNLQEQLSTMNK